MKNKGQKHKSVESNIDENALFYECVPKEQIAKNEEYFSSLGFKNK